MTVAVLGGAAVAMTVRPSDSSGASSVETPVGVSFPAGFSFLSFFFLLPDCLSWFPCRYPWFFGFSISVVPLSLSVGFSLFRFLSPFAAVLSFFLFFWPPSPFFCTRTVFIGAGGAGTTLPRPIICMGCEVAAPSCHGTGWDVQWAGRLQGTASLSVASGFSFNRARGEGERGRNKRKRTKTFLPLLRVQGKKKEEQCRLKRHCFVFPLSFFLNAWNGVVLPKTRRFL